MRNASLLIVLEPGRGHGLYHNFCQVQPHIPEHLPIGRINWVQIIPLIGSARAAVGRYDGTLSSMVNPDVLLAPLQMNEAVLSAKIEGTQTTLQQVMLFEAGDPAEPRKSGDFQEVINYRSALRTASAIVSDRPLSLHLIEQIHHNMMQGVRGQDKEPGRFRREQNYIAPEGSTIEDARYVPPTPLIMQDCLQNLEKYFKFSEVDPIVQAAIIHAQFEIIHPFKDGNGRVGRILIPLYLFNKGVLRRPVLYLSDYLEAHHEEYAHRLLAITRDGDWDGWIEFFLKATTKQAEANTKTVDDIARLYDAMKARLYLRLTLLMSSKSLTRSSATQHLARDCSGAN